MNRRSVFKRGSLAGNKGQSWRIDRVLTGLDRFGQNIPAFNLNGETNVKTIAGGFFTLVIFLLTLSYAALKLVELLVGRNPTINDSNIDGFFDKSTTLNFNEIGWRMAFTIEDEFHSRRIQDSRYVKWIVRLYITKDGKQSEKRLHYHRCTAEDYASFYPVSSAS